MQRTLALGYALVAYLVFFATFLWLIAFLADVALFPTTVNDAVNGASPGVAVVINLVLIALFGLQHSLMARPAFKARWTTGDLASVERSTYVLARAIVLAVCCAILRTPSTGRSGFRATGAAPISGGVSR